MTTITTITMTMRTDPPADHEKLSERAGQGTAPAFSAWAAAAVILLFYLSADLAGITTCPFRFFFGLSCAGCGMSRAWHLVLQGDPAGAFSVHPLFLMPLVAAVLMLLKRHIPERLFNVLFGLGAVLMLGVWLVRLAGGTDGIVYFRPEEGLVFRILARLRELMLQSRPVS